VAVFTAALDLAVRYTNTEVSKSVFFLLKNTDYPKLSLFSIYACTPVNGVNWCNLYSIL